MQKPEETELVEKMGEMTIAPFTIPAGGPFDTTFCVSIPVQNELNQRVLVRRNLTTVIIEFIIYTLLFQIVPIFYLQGEPYFYRIGLPGTKGEGKEIKIEEAQLYRCTIGFKVNIDDETAISDYLIKKFLPLPPIHEFTPTKTPTSTKKRTSATRRRSGGDKTATDDDADTVIDFAGAHGAMEAVDEIEGAKKA
jgi:hypothetical protein